MFRTRLLFYILGRSIPSCLIPYLLLQDTLQAFVGEFSPKVREKTLEWNGNRTEISIDRLRSIKFQIHTEIPEVEHEFFSEKICRI